jgi:hypothetical protein
MGIKVQMAVATKRSRAAMAAAINVIRDHFVYLAKAGCLSSNSW